MTGLEPSARVVEPLIGRIDEQLAIERIIAAARVGSSGALVLRGDPGSGKSSLLDAAIATAPDFAVLTVAGTESELDWGYSGLRRMLQPVLDHVETMDDPHAGVLRSALGYVGGLPIDRPVRFAVGLSVLNVLSEIASRRPLLCVIDDVQWLDSESREALALVGRRIQADRIAMLFASRSPGNDLDGIPTLEIHGLAVDDAIDLLRRVAGSGVDELVARHVALETDGLPLAIVELAGTLSSHRLATEAAKPEPLPVGGQLQAHFLKSIDLLPADTRTLLLVKAADSSGEPRVVSAAAAALGAGRDASAAAIAAGIIGPLPELEFRHPMIRSAVYSSASLEQRGLVHRALAASIDPSSDPDRHTWHLAAAANREDGDVAQLLEDAAVRGAVRGAYVSSGRFLQRAMELTEDPAARASRLLAAADAYLVGGAPARSKALLEDQSPTLVDPIQRAIALRLLGGSQYSLGEAIGTVAVLMEAAVEIAPFDLHAARATLIRALAAARVTSRFSPPGESYGDVADLARTLSIAPDVERSTVDLLIDGNLALFFDGHAAAVPLLRDAFEQLRAGAADDAFSDRLLWLSVGCWAAGALGDEDVLRILAGQLTDEARARTALESLSQGLIWLGLSDLMAGSLADARTRFSERSRLLAAVGRSAVDVGELLTVAWMGLEDETRREAEIVERYAVEHAHGWMLPFVEYSMVVLELGLGNAAAALDAANRDYQDNPFLSLYAFPDLIEAAIRAGRRATAEGALVELERRAVASDTPMARGLLARCRAMVADDDTAEAFHVLALAEFAACRGPLQLARTHLVYGEWLRRQRRRIDAREQLRPALALFEEIGAGGFAERARSELAATGAHARRRSVDTVNQLTPQELQIVRLVASGATNAEIAEQMFISRSTVDYHLGKIYRRLGISSRRKLREIVAVPTN